MLRRAARGRLTSLQSLCPSCCANLSWCSGFWSGWKQARSLVDLGWFFRCVSRKITRHLRVFLDPYQASQRRLELDYLCLLRCHVRFLGGCDDVLVDDTLIGNRRVAPLTSVGALIAEYNALACKEHHIAWLDQTQRTCMLVTVEIHVVREAT